LVKAKPAHAIVAVVMGLVITQVQASPASWQQTGAPNESWSSVASSADGSRLVAAANGPIYTSTDSGATWQQTSAPFTNWVAVASSGDGTKLVAVVDGGLIYSSTNAGGAWTATTAPSRQWKSAACSGDGTHQVAVCAQGFLDGGIYLSSNSGDTWALASAPGTGWYSVASSADGTKLAAMTTDSLTPAGPYGWVYVSADAGRTWTQSARVQWPTSLASSADGTRLMAATGEQGFTFSGGLMLSTDSGATWAKALTNAPVHVWSSAVTSADGSQLAVGTGGLFSSQIVGPVYTSSDSGLTWSTSDSPVKYWTALAMSADGGRVVAAAKDEGIYTRQTTPSPSLSIATSGGKAVISWRVPSTTFELEENSHPTGTNWTLVGTAPSLNFTNLQHQVTVSVTGNSVFYRLRSF
jgi:hypothetical protein